MPAVKSRPAPSAGATPARLVAARHRSGSRAAQPSARGPPPDQPRVTNSPTPSASSSSALSATSSAMAGALSSGRGVDAPYPGREKVIRRSPASRAARDSGAYSTAALGVPEW